MAGRPVVMEIGVTRTDAKMCTLYTHLRVELVYTTDELKRDKFSVESDYTLNQRTVYQFFHTLIPHVKISVH